MHFIFLSDIVYQDPALWPSKLNENRRERIKYLDKGNEFFQNKNSTFKTSKRAYKSQNRYFSPNHFYRTLPNGEKCERNWLMFSESTGNVFCYPCKLFTKNQNNSFVDKGFSNWNKTEDSICSHENSNEHKRCTMEWLDYMVKDARIDKKVIDLMETEEKYWTEVLRRVVSVIKFLSKRGLSFRGKDEKFGSPKNGNYLGALELIAEYDPFLKAHIETYGNKGRGSVSYLSKTICEEFIDLISKKIMDRIKNEMGLAKYWGLIVDSTPDVSHADQLSVVFRYFLNKNVYERFFCFLQINSHKGRSLCDDILALLSENDIDIADCRAQTYDNASNMSGEYNGLQACLREKNALAFYVPCSGHSLNLVGECSVEECINAINFFGFLQGLYNFFSASTSRWDLLSCILCNQSDTRWSRKFDAVKAYVKNCDCTHEALVTISQDKEQRAATRHEAEALLKNMVKLENAFMAVFWLEILNRFESTSHYLQKVNTDLISANSMLLSLVSFVSNLREQFSKFENEAKNLGSFINKEYSDERKRQITRKLSDKGTQTEHLWGSDKFRVETFYLIIDKLIAELTKRSKAYDHITQLFGFLTQLLTMESVELENQAKALIEVYSNDLNNDLLIELKHFVPRVKLQERGFFFKSFE